MLAGHERLIVVFGMAHSGTTILAYLLSQHPEVRLATDGDEAWILENTWLPLEQAEPIQAYLNEHPGRRALLKRPWACVHNAAFLKREMPNARFIYCYRDFDEIAESWSKPESLVNEQLRGGGRAFQRERYDDYWGQAHSFGESVPHFRDFLNRTLLESPQECMEELSTWLGLSPFRFNTSQVGMGRDVKRLLAVLNEVS